MLQDSWNAVTKISDVKEISLARGRSAFEHLQTFLDGPGTVLAWLYTLDAMFIEKFAGLHLTLGKLYVITDYRTRRDAATCAARWQNFHARSWATNRTMHDKTWIHTATGRVIFTTANATTGSWTLSKNRCLLIDSHELSNDLIDEFWSTWQDCRPILPRDSRYLSPV